MSQVDTVGAVYLLREDGAALLQHRDDKPGLRNAGMWVPPGGHCESGETSEACARREVYEETDYQCGDLFHLATVEDVQHGWPVYRLVVFWGAYDGVQQVCCREGQALEFIERQAAGKLQMPRYLVELWDRALEERINRSRMEN